MTRTAADPISGPAGPALGWCALQALHGRIEAHLERALAPHGISVRKYSVLDVLARQHDGDGGHLQMKDLAAAVTLSQSATTRLVARLEDRGLLERYICPTDRRGIYTEVTPAGRSALADARGTHDAALADVLDRLAGDPHVAPLVAAVRVLG